MKPNTSSRSMSTMHTIALKVFLSMLMMPFSFIHAQREGLSRDHCMPTVSTTADNGPGSLREAITNANFCGGALITFAHHLANQTIVLESEIVITNAMFIQGLGSDQLTISAEGNSRIFSVEQLPNATDSVKIEGVALKNGNSYYETYYNKKGGAIYNAGRLILNNCILEKNDYPNQIQGGAIYNTGNLWIRQSEVSNNRIGYPAANAYGGGLYNAGNAYVQNSKFAKNWAAGPGAGGAIYHTNGILEIVNTSIVDNFAGAAPVKTAGLGGGICVKDGSVNIVSSTFNDNLSDGGGGAILNQNGFIGITNSTISNNEAFYGGGIENYHSGTVYINHSTIVNNLADQKERVPPVGGGIRNDGQLIIANSIVALNIVDPVQIPGAPPVGPSDIAGNGNVNSLGYNLIGANINSIAPSTGDLFGSFANPLNPAIGNLENNGGLTQTHALFLGSPAINAANPTSNTSVDQRGQPRPFNGRADIGAVESQILPPPPTCETNIAIGKTVVASSLENNSHIAAHVVDGNLNTRWASQWDDPEWIYVDLGDIYEICRVVLKWERAYGRDFQIEVSNDATTWRPIASIVDNHRQTNILDDLRGSGRYVRMLGTQRATPWGYSLFEFEVYGRNSAGNLPPSVASATFDIAPYSANGTFVGQVQASDPDGVIVNYGFLGGNDGSLTINGSTGEIRVANGALMIPGRTLIRQLRVTDNGNLSAEATITVKVRELVTDCETNIALNRLAVASSEEDDDFGLLPASYAFDGDPNTRWSSVWSDPQWIYVDLGSRYDLCKVVLKWETAMAKNYRIEISDDAQNWISIHHVNGNYSSNNTIENLNGTGRYVRIYGTQRTTQWGYSLYEFEVYGTSASNRMGRESEATVSKLNIFPNPAKDIVNVSFEDTSSNLVEVTVYSLQGQKLITRTYEAIKGQNQLKLQLGELSAGTYLLQLSDAQMQMRKRLVIVR